MSDVRVGAPHGTDCGDVFTLDSREVKVHWTRKLAGPVTKTKESDYKCQCSQSPVYYLPVSGNGTMMAVCRQHLEGRQ